MLCLFHNAFPHLAIVSDVIMVCEETGCTHFFFTKHPGTAPDAPIISHPFFPVQHLTICTQIQG